MSALWIVFEGDVITKQQGLVKAVFNDGFTLERQDGKTVVMKDGEVVKDKKFDPKPLNDILLSVAKDYGFQIKSPDTGGHGGGSSKKKANMKGVTWNEYLEKNDVLPNTDAADKLYAEWNASQ